MKSYLKLFLILVSFGYVLNVAQAKLPEDIRQAEIPEDIDQAHKAVWKLVQPEGHGTAFFIGPNHVVTNFHVINGSKESNKSCSIEDLYLIQGDTRLKINKVLYVSAVDDLVILETKEPVSEYLNLSKKKRSWSLLIQDYFNLNVIKKSYLGRLFALGYPKGVKQTLIHSERYGVIDDGYHYEMAVDQIDDLRGLSGGPVLDWKKKVIGIVYVVYDNLISVKKVSKLEELRRGVIGLDCSELSLRSCIEQAIKDLKNKAEGGDRLAQEFLAKMHYEGVGVEEDKEEAYKWWLAAANQGLYTALFHLADSYYEGVGVDQDKEEAYKLGSQVANLGNILALNMIAQMYYEGEGVEEDKKEAYKRWSKAANLGYILAQEALDSKEFQDYRRTVYVKSQEVLDKLNSFCRKIFNR